MSLSSSWRFSFHAYGGGRERETGAFGLRRSAARDLRWDVARIGYITVFGLEWRCLIKRSAAAATPRAWLWKNGAFAETCGALRGAADEPRATWPATVARGATSAAYIVRGKRGGPPDGLGKRPRQDPRGMAATTARAPGLPSHAGA